MSVKELKVTLLDNNLTIEATSIANEHDTAVWRNVKRSLLSLMVGNEKKSALAITPADDPEHLMSLSGATCSKLTSTDCDCFLFPPQMWPANFGGDIVDCMSFSLGQLWFFKEPQGVVDVNQLIDTIFKCVEEQQLPETSLELLGCTADDTTVCWLNYPKTKDGFIDSLHAHISAALAITSSQWKIMYTNNGTC